MTPQLYSFNHQWPQELPFRVRLADGGSRTDPETFTAAELTSWGYTGPYDKPNYDSYTQRVEWDGEVFIVVNIND